MPNLSTAFEFLNPWMTKNSHTTQVSITMPQMVNGQRPPSFLTIYSKPTRAAGFYKLGSRTHYATYVIEGSFKGSCIIQTATTPAPGDNDFIDVIGTQKTYTGLETTGGAGISGGFSGAISRPIKTDIVQFTGDYSWIRVKLTIAQGTLQSVKLNF